MKNTKILITAILALFFAFNYQTSAQTSYYEIQQFCDNNQSILKDISLENQSGSVIIRENVQSNDRVIFSSFEVYVIERKFHLINCKYTKLKISGAMVNDSVLTLLIYYHDNSQFNLSPGETMLYLIDIKNREIRLIPNLLGIINGLRISNDGSIITSQDYFVSPKVPSTEAYSIITWKENVVFLESYSIHSTELH